MTRRLSSLRRNAGDPAFPRNSAQDVYKRQVLPLCGVLNMVYTAMNIYDIVKGNIPVLPTSEEDSLVDNLKKEEA